MGDSAYFLKRHLIFILTGIFLTSVVMAVDYHLFNRYSKLILITAISLLALVLIPGIGSRVSGAQRWFRFFGLSFQPSELAQIAVIIYAASFLSRRHSLIDDFAIGILPVLAVAGFTSGLILIQPDLGTALAINMVVFIMLFVAGMKKKHILLLFLIALPALYLTIFAIPYRRARVLAFLNPWNDPRGSGFQIIQSQLALGSGGVLGTGLGAGQQKLFYLPAAHTDFIFSIIGEELGILGTLSVCFLFLNFIIDGFKVSMNTKDRFGYFLSLGLICILGFKVLVNMGVSVGAFPTKGLPLPFISYGGTSLVFDMISVGLLLNISKTCDQV